jgi:hypothetical protein
MFWQNRLKQINGMSPRALQVVGVIIAVSVLLCLFVPARTPDSDRYESQARSILEGKGYRTWGNPETTLPPGYPLFIAAIEGFGGNSTWVRVVQVFIYIASCVVIFSALKARSRAIAFCGMCAIALQPFPARLAGYILSETYAIFLSSIYAFLISEICWRENAKPLSLFLFGLITVLLPLTSPATAILAGLVLTAIVLTKRGRGLGYILIGMSLVYFPWQYHCQKALGKPCVLLYSSQNAVNQTLSDESGLGLWMRTWLLKQEELAVGWHPEKIREVPARAFISAEERQRLTEALNSDTLSREEKDRIFRDRARVLIQQDPLSFYLTLPIRRVLYLWFDMPQFGHIQMEYVGRISPGVFKNDVQQYGPKRAFMRLFKGVISTVVYPIYISMAILLIILALLILGRHRKAIPIAIVVGIFAYIAIAGYSGMVEARRNVVFFPLIILLLGFAFDKRRDDPLPSVQNP